MSGDRGLYAGQSDLNLFPFRKPYEYGVKMSQELSDKMIGRSIATPHDAGILVQAVLNSKHGDHVEIGTFFGHTAILVAMAKKEFGMHGDIYCVDPWQYRPEVVRDWGVKDVATMETVKANAKKFGVADVIKTIPHKSYPWPTELDGKTFATGYIDGDHWNGMPGKDWETLREVVTYSIIIDDYCWGKTEVIDAVIEAMQDPLWLPVQLSGLTAVLRRRH
jgi:hypothetical protein